MRQAFTATYRTADVAKLGPSLRQLQWWDEHNYVRPDRDGHNRVYSLIEAALAAVLYELREKSLSRRVVLKLNRHGIRRALRRVIDGEQLYLLTTAKGRLAIESDQATMIEHLVKARDGYVMVSLRDCVTRVLSLN
jgi:hypothetical protein